MYRVCIKLPAVHRNGCFSNGDALDGIQREDLVKYAAEFTAGGVSLRPDAMRALYEKFAPGGTKTSRRKKDRHRLTGRITCRLEDADMEALQQRMKADGYATAQELMTALVRRYLAGEVEA